MGTYECDDWLYSDWGDNMVVGNDTAGDVPFAGTLTVTGSLAVQSCGWFMVRCAPSVPDAPPTRPRPPAGRAVFLRD